LEIKHATFKASLGKQVSSDEEEDTTDNDDHNSAIAASDSDAEQQVGPSTSRRAKRTKVNKATKV